MGTAQVATWLGMSREQVWRLWSSGKLPGYRLDRNLRFAPEDVHAFLDSRYSGTPTMTSSGRPAKRRTPTQGHVTSGTDYRPI
ncbi:MAG: Helix-turn-helix domain [Thermoleophilia bacterium]|nr:Helix-turn-helix domain [Thermoleophilia bacterium]